MDVFYIVKMNGYFKSYYSEQGDSLFNNSIRKAKGFKTIEEANQMIEGKKFENCYVINQFGQEQK